MTEPDYMYCLTMCGGHDTNCGAFTARYKHQTCVYKDLMKPDITEREISRIERIIEEMYKDQGHLVGVRVQRDKLYRRNEK